VGSRLTDGNITLIVTGIVQPLAPRSSFWTADPIAAAPSLNPASKYLPSCWLGAAFVGPAEVADLEAAFDGSNVLLEWDFPLTLGAVDASDAATLQQHLATALNGSPAGTLGVSALATISSGLPTVLGPFLSATRAVGVLMSLLFASLGVLAAVVVLLGAALLAGQREEEFALMRARGCSLWQLAAVAARGTAAVSLPAAAAGAAAGLAATPGPAVPASWWLAGLVVAAALAGPPLIAAWRQRGTGRSGLAGQRPPEPAAARRPRAARWVAEIALVAAAAGGLVVLRQQGLPQTGGGNLYTSLAPILVAVPAALVVTRLCPLAVRGLLRLTRRRASAATFVGLAAAARSAAATVLPAFALVLALAVIAFGAMVHSAVARGQVAASWQATGADAAINSNGADRSLTPATQRDISAAAGPVRAAAVLLTSGSVPGGSPVDVAVVSPAAYAALTATTPFPRFPADKLRPGGPGRPGAPGKPGRPGKPGARRGAPAPALFSPGAAALLGRQALSLQTPYGTLAVRQAGTLAATPALPGDRTFVILPAWAAAARLRGLPAPNLLLLTAARGAQLNQPALTAAVRRQLPGGTLTLRSAALAALTRAPLTHGAYLTLAEGTAAAAGLALVALLLALLLTARRRQHILARLSAMGLSPGQGRRLAVLETTPPILAAAVGGLAAAVALVPLVGPSVNLAVFTGSGAPVPLTASYPALAATTAALLVLALATLTAHSRITSHSRSAATLRADT
jgi:putative ABC transport system permease protein